MVDDIPELDGAFQCPCRRSRVALRLAEEAIGLCRIQQICTSTPRDEIGVAVQVLPGGGAGMPVEGVGEVETYLARNELRRNLFESLLGS